ncbi:MAG: DUF2135 domain-containing protein [Bacteroidia bacterium]|nr:DUF2135 domain-containing protein [Bacteroidia bacterium]
MKNIIAYSVSLFSLLILFSCKGQKQAFVVKKDLPEDNLPSPTILASVEDSLQAMILDSLKIHTLIKGSIARTTYELVFYNPHEQQLAGKFFFPKERNQMISRFALEIEGKWREAVVVPAEKGRVAFENTVRKNVDPALVEYASGNIFKAMVFPLPPKGRRRMQISFDERLYSVSAKEFQSLFQFRSLFKEKIPYVLQEVFVEGKAKASMLDHPSIEGLQPIPTGLYGKTEGTNKFVEDFSILQKGDSKEATTIVEEGQGGETWFSALVEAPFNGKQRARPGRVILYWDVSHQGKKRKPKQDLEALTLMLKKSMSKEFELTVHFFDFGIRKSKTYKIAEYEDILPLLEEIKLTPFDGMADFDLLKLRKADYPADKCPDEIWLFSNGQSPFGEEQSGDIPFYSILSAPTHNYPFLNKLSRESGGDLIDIYNEGMAAIESSFMVNKPRLMEIEVVKGKVAELYPRIGTAVQSPFFLQGKLLSDECELLLKFGYEKGEGQYPYKVKATINKAQNLGSGNLLAKQWASSKLSFLMESPRKNKDAILELGMKHKLISPQTPMIVLDRIQDYIDYRIEPPEEWKATYQKAIAYQEKKKKVKLLTHLDELAEEFEARKIWWDTEFKIPDGMYQQEPKTKSRESGASNDDEEDYDTFGVFSGTDDLPPPPPLGVEKKNKANKAIEGGISMAKPKLDAAYFEAFKEQDEKSWDSIYFKQKKDYGRLPAFYLDMADWFYDKGQGATALRIVSNLGVLELSNHELMRILAYRFQQWGKTEQAIILLEQVLDIRGEEPQSYRDLGLAHASIEQYQEAIDWLYEVVRRPWNDRFPEVGVVAAHEINAIIARSEEPLATSEIDERFIADLPCDLRIVMGWDANDVDLDLWVIDPRGEKCYYRHQLTEIGGMISKDFTGGYGPEEFLIKNAMKGRYKIKANYYGDNRQSLNGHATLYVKAILDYGRKGQRSQDIILRLEREKQVLEIGEIVVE